MRPITDGLRSVLIVVARQPVPGQAKTRLCPPLDHEQSACLYECFLRDTLDLARRLPGVLRVLAYQPHSAAEYFTALAPDFELIPQEGPDLGIRLDNALCHYLRLGHPSVVVMDSDSPTLPLGCLEAAFRALSQNDGLGTTVPPGREADVVLGPCADGGYYLIGLVRPASRLLREVRMSTPKVTAQTMALAVEEGLRLALLAGWHDVDGPAELAGLARELRRAGPDVAPHTRAFLEANPDLLSTLSLGNGWCA